MAHTPLISPAALQRALADPLTDVLVLDCSFDLADTGAGRRQYAAGHIPGAQYVHLVDTLSAAKTGRNGRHPLPERAVFAQTMAALGANDRTLVVACDSAGGMFAARLWWMLRWAGHAATAVLDGAMGAWKAEGGALQTDTPPARTPGNFSLRESLVATVDCAGLRGQLGSNQHLVLDARAADRFRGENETLDPVAGRIPGARNRPFRDNLAADGRFKHAAILRTEFQALLGEHAPASVVNQCGSGVTACHNLLALEVAGLPGSALYPGSWSEWCAQPGAPVATGFADLTTELR